MSSSRVTKRLQPVVWDAQNQSCLYIPTVRDGNMQVNQIWADPGVGCNEFELTALMKIIQYHEEYMTTKADILDGNNNAETTDKILKSNLRILSTKYRAAVRDCLADWERSMELNANDMNISERGMNSENVYENFELLQMVHSMIHLADIFLPLLPSSHSWDYPIDPYQKPGLATAETIRYLRYHHLGNVEDNIPDLDAEEVEEMLNSAQPELFKGGQAYWKYICQLALRGCLEDVWNVLSKHSLYVTANSVCSYSTDINKNNPNYFAQMLQVCEGFSELKELLFRAPLPGGRNDKFDDDDLKYDNRLDSEIDVANLFLDGLYVDPGDYQLWDLAHESIAFPVLQNEKEAIQRHRQWSQFIKDNRRSFKLSKRIREVDSVLAILSGDFSSVSFCNWSQMLCSELLYQHPEYRPIQISKRTKQIVNNFKKNEGETNGVETDALVRVMEGDAAIAIEWIYVAGGASGAPLPCALMSLIYNLFVESKIMAADLDYRKTEFLREASTSILSSLAKFNPDVGAQLAVRLLVPYTVQEKNDELVAEISNAVKLYFPSSDDDVDTLISFLTPLIDLKSIQTLESCVDMLTCRYRTHKQDNKIGQAIRALVTGIELERKMIAPIQACVCHKWLSAECNQVSLSLVKTLCGDIAFDPNQLVRATDIATTLELYNFDMSLSVQAKLLIRILYVVENLGKAGFEQEVANRIILCLEKLSAVDGTYLLECPSPFPHYFLRLACQLVEYHDERKSETKCPFDKKQISTLMELFNALIEQSEWTIEGSKTIHHALAVGLANAIVYENTQRKQQQTSIKSTAIDISAIRSPHILDYSIDIQEEVVRRMLDF